MVKVHIITINYKIKLTFFNYLTCINNQITLKIAINTSFREKNISKNFSILIKLVFSSKCIIYQMKYMIVIENFDQLNTQFLFKFLKSKRYQLICKL